jgi:hypothetical protein
MLKTSMDLRRWFRYVNQKLGEISVNWDRLKISRTAKREEKKFLIAKWAKS